MEATQFTATSMLSRDEEDLKWFFTHSPRPIGIVSSYPAMVHRLERLPEPQGGHPSDRDRVGEALDHLRRRARIQAILAATRETSVARLRTLFEPTPQKLAGYGLVASLVAHTLEAEIAHRASRTRLPLAIWLEHLHRRSATFLSARRIKEALVLAAHQSLRQAVMDYREGKRRTGLTGRADPMPCVAVGGRHG